MSSGYEAIKKVFKDDFKSSTDIGGGNGVFLVTKDEFTSWTCEPYMFVSDGDLALIHLRTYTGRELVRMTYTTPRLMRMMYTSVPPADVVCQIEVMKTWSTWYTSLIRY